MELTYGQIRYRRILNSNNGISYYKRKTVDCDKCSVRVLISKIKDYIESPSWTCDVCKGEHRVIAGTSKTRGRPQGRADGPNVDKSNRGRPKGRLDSGPRKSRKTEKPLGRPKGRLDSVKRKSRSGEQPMLDVTPNVIANDPPSSA
jgi:hypothetical protein